MTLLMSCIMSLVISIFNLGLVSNIISLWLSAQVFAFMFVFPSVILISPSVHKLVSLFLKDESTK